MPPHYFDIEVHNRGFIYLQCWSIRSSSILPRRFGQDVDGGFVVETYRQSLKLFLFCIRYSDKYQTQVRHHPALIRYSKRHWGW